MKFSRAGRSPGSGRQRHRALCRLEQQHLAGRKFAACAQRGLISSAAPHLSPRKFPIPKVATCHDRLDRLRHSFLCVSLVCQRQTCVSATNGISATDPDRTRRMVVTPCQRTIDASTIGHRHRFPHKCGEPVLSGRGSVLRTFMDASDWTVTCISLGWKGHHSCENHNICCH
jgi:hypothetical protein